MERYTLLEEFVLKLDDYFRTCQIKEEKRNHIRTLFAEIKYLAKRLISKKENELEYISVVRDFSDINEKCALFFRGNRSKALDCFGEQELLKFRAFCSVMVNAILRKVKKISNDSEKFMSDIVDVFEEMPDFEVYNSEKKDKNIKDIINKNESDLVRNNETEEKVKKWLEREII
jgi:hypothetical protein